MKQNSLLNRLRYTLQQQNGVLFSSQCIAGRNTYTGRNVLGLNDSIDPSYRNVTDQDDRGYVPVESWILSHTSTVNAIPKPNEGVSQLLLYEDNDNMKQSQIYFNELLSNYDCKNILFDDLDLNKWPLIKILDIGGKPILHNNQMEAPPIPVHVHNGIIDSITGQHYVPPKDEAYFFPPIPDFAKSNTLLNEEENETIYSRLGVRSDVSQETFLKTMNDWGVNSSMYDLLNSYKLEINTGWTIFGGIIHSPGPILTLEIQRAQDDYNLLSWHLGVTLNDKNELETLKKQHLYKDCEYVINHKIGSERFIMDTLINWDLSIDNNFEENNKRNRLLLNEGEFGQHHQIFFDIFYGESLIIKSGQKYQLLNKLNQPLCGIVWNGKGLINNVKINAMDNNCREFLVGNEYCNSIEFVNNNTDTDQDLIIYLLYPLQD